MADVADVLKEESLQELISLKQAKNTILLRILKWPTNRGLAKRHGKSRKNSRMEQHIKTQVFFLIDYEE